MPWASNGGRHGNAFCPGAGLLKGVKGVRVKLGAEPAPAHRGLGSVRLEPETLAWRARVTASCWSPGGIRHSFGLGVDDVRREAADGMEEKQARTLAAA
ncbi:hypothetical protein GCM10027168_70940 [Streptomyces capparidis]